MKTKSSRFKNIIVCGDVGTGTSTLSEGLAKKLGWRHISAGSFFRDYSKKHHLPLWDKRSVPDEIDRKIDNELLEIIRSGENVVIDSHYGGWFARNLAGVFRVLLVCDRVVATKRVLERSHTHPETPAEIEERRRQLREKFRKLYSRDDYENPKYFHLVIDTTATGVDQTLSAAYNKLLASS